MSPTDDDTGLPDYPDCQDEDGYLIGCCWPGCVGSDCMDPESDECAVERTTSYPSVSYLEAPDRADWGESACDELDPDREWGTDSLCRVTLDERTIDDFTSMDVDSYSSTLKVYSTTDTRLRSGTSYELILTAWALLHENLDLIQWAACWASGDESRGDCIVKRITRNSRVVEVHLESGCDFKVQSNVVDLWGAIPLDFSGGGIAICTDSELWTSIINQWQYGSSATNALCAATILASTFVHELVHLCWRAWGDDPGECKESYLVETIFAWAMSQRYPDITSVTCCDFLGGVFASDLGSGYDAECVKAPASGAAGGMEWIETKSTMEAPWAVE